MIPGDQRRGTNVLGNGSYKDYVIRNYRLSSRFVNFRKSLSRWRRAQETATQIFMRKQYLLRDIGIEDAFDEIKKNRLLTGQNKAEDQIF